ncbi:MAG: ricin-type beta-trefoil lectin domain protein [Bryobacteraceae bacterium]
MNILLFALIGAVAMPGFAAGANRQELAPTPPMGWNDWAHYQCGYTAETILANAKGLVRTGLAARGYNTVTIDDCWMQKDRDSRGDLQADPQRFPHGMKALADAIHSMGLKFGIYEDSGYATCGGFAGSGAPNGGGKAHFLQDARLFASWGVDYLKLDGCNVYVSPGSNKVEARRKAYSAESRALKATGRPIVFSESATDCCRFGPYYYDVLSWVGKYGQLWRVGNDVATFHASHPDRPRFHSVLWNYAVNLQLGRFQKPGNWDDPDFVIGGDPGMSLAETRSQMALWSMMSSPLNLSSDLTKLSAQAIAILGNKSVIAIDQDPLGKMATLVERSPATDVLFKRLAGGEYAVAVLNHGSSPIHVRLQPAQFGFSASKPCRLNARNLWNGRVSSSLILVAHVASHDTGIWRVHAPSSCGVPTRTGAIIMAVPLPPGTNWRQKHPNERHPSIQEYTRCLTASGTVGACADTAAERWTITPGGALKSGRHCLGARNGKVVMEACNGSSTERWKYNPVGNLIDSDGRCLSASGPYNRVQGLRIRACGHNQPAQIWSLPN